MQIHLFGGGGHALEVMAEYRAEAASSWGRNAPIPIEFVTWAEEKFARPGDRVARPDQPPDKPVILAIGDPSVRARVAAEFLSWRWGRHVSSRAVRSDPAEVAGGAYIAPLVYLGPHASVRYLALVNHGAHVSHEVVVGEYCHIAIGAMLCGKVQVGIATEIGAGAVLLPGVKVGSGCHIGAGAVVVESVTDSKTVVGVPATRVL